MHRQENAEAELTNRTSERVSTGFQTCARHCAGREVKGKEISERQALRHTVQVPKFRAGSSGLQYLEICIVVREGDGRWFLLLTDTLSLSLTEFKALREKLCLAHLITTNPLGKTFVPGYHIGRKRGYGLAALRTSVQL